MPTLLRSPLMLAALLAAAAPAVACGSGDQATSGAVGGALTSTASCSAACSVGSRTPSPGAPAACTNPGSGRTDDLKQQVALRAQPDGLQLGDITTGTGAPVRAGQVVTLEYTGWLQDGTPFDSSRSPGRTPLTTVFGAHGLIPGFEEALATMRVGGVRRAVIPAALAYGPGGQGPIPPDATLTFDIEVLCAG